MHMFPTVYNYGLARSLSLSLSLARARSLSLSRPLFDRILFLWCCLL